MILAQLPSVTAGEIGNWLVIAAAVAIIASSIKKLFVRKPSIEEEFVTKAEHEKDIREIRTGMESLRSKVDRDAERIMAKLDENKQELMLDGRRRSSTLFEHIKETNTEIFARLNNQDKLLARLEERTHG